MKNYIKHDKLIEDISRCAFEYIHDKNQHHFFIFEK